MKMPPSGYMVYVLIDPRDMVPFYVGMTSRPGARWNGLNWDPSCNAYRRLTELRRLRLKCRVRLAATNLSLDDARDRERQMISFHRKTIVNYRPLSHRQAAQ